MSSPSVAITLDRIAIFAAIPAFVGGFILMKSESRTATMLKNRVRSAPLVKET